MNSTPDNWNGEDVLKRAAVKLLAKVDAKPTNVAVDVASQLLARFLSRRMLGPLAEQFGVLPMFKALYNQDNEHIREKIDEFVQLIALAMPDPTPDSLNDPEFIRARGTVRDFSDQELEKIIADPGDDVLSALRNDFGPGAPAVSRRTTKRC